MWTQAYSIRRQSVHTALRNRHPTGLLNSGRSPFHLRSLSHLLHAPAAMWCMLQAEHFEQRNMPPPPANAAADRVLEHKQTSCIGEAQVGSAQFICPAFVAEKRHSA